MKKGKKLTNLNSGKEAIFIKKDDSHTWIQIDSIVTPLPNNIFFKIYKEAKE